MRDIRIVWFEGSDEGTAAGQHLRGTLRRLEDQAIVVNEVISVSGDQKEGWAGRFRRLSSVMWRSILASSRDGIFIVRWHPFALLPLACHRLKGGRSILLIQGNSADLRAAYPFTSWLPVDSLIIKPSLRLGNVHVAPTQGIMRWIEQDLNIHKEQRIVVENGFDDRAVDKCQPLSGDELSLAGVTSGEYGVFVGKFAPWQGVDVILEAVDRADWPSDLPVVFVGDGQLTGAVLASAKTNPLVRYVGRVEPQVALAWTKQAAFSIAARRSGPASDRGVSPYKVLEAAALGTPLIATRVCGQMELVQALGNGLVVAPDSAEAISQAAALLWSDRSLRRELASTGVVNARGYSWAAGSDKLRMAIESLDRVDSKSSPS